MTGWNQLNPKLSHHLLVTTLIDELKNIRVGRKNFEQCTEML